MSEYVLEMENINKSFFGVQVLYDASLSVKPGEVHALLGENGAGKSTLIKILSSAYRRETGSIKINGEEVHVTTPKAAMDAGISVIFQEFNLNPHAPIYENIFLGREILKNGLVDKEAEIKEASDLMTKMGLVLDPRTEVGTLSTAQKQMVEITKALSMNAKIFVFDEPTASITDKETELLFTIIRKLKEQQAGIIYISHRLDDF